MSTTLEPRAAGAPERPTVARPNRRRRHLLEWAAVLVLAAVVAVCLRAFVVETFFVPSGSMIPTLEVGDRMLVDKLPWVRDNIHPGDIIVFHKTPADSSPGIKDLVKRVVGMPGQTIWSRGDTIFVEEHGRTHVLAEPWLPRLAGACYQRDFGIKRTTIPRDDYFVLGDCRGDSYDSRYWGFVPRSNIVGKVFVVIWRHGHPWFHWF